MRRLRTLAALALVVITTITLTAAPAAAALTSYITNSATNPVSIGVIADRDGRYVHGNYDALLPPGQRTDRYLKWTSHAAGYYIGAGWCATSLYQINGQELPYHLDVPGPAHLWLPQSIPDETVARWRVRLSRLC